jgi:hypothetical protein
MAIPKTLSMSLFLLHILLGLTRRITGIYAQVGDMSEP